MKNIKWGNVLVLILFAGSFGLFVGDSFAILAGATFTWYGFITGFINIMILIGTSAYIYGECYEE